MLGRGHFVDRESSSVFGGPVVRHGLAIVICILAALSARFWLVQFELMQEPTLVPFVDMTTYLAAGERLNEGHQLYRLVDGDRPVFFGSGSPVALFSPPTMGAMWRPIAGIPLGPAVWVAACWTSLLGTLYILVHRIGLPAAVVGAALAIPIGQQLAVANVAAFFPMLSVLTWSLRRTPASGAIVGTMAALKISPGTMIGWILARRDIRMLAWALGGIGAWFLIGLIGAGSASYLDYVAVAGDIAPSENSLSAISGLPWLSPAVLVAGTLIALSLGNHPRLSFAVAIAASVLGHPAVFVASFAPLLGAMAPLMPDGQRRTRVTLTPITTPEPFLDH